MYGCRVFWHPCRVAGGRERSPSIRESLQEYGRGLAGGLLFSLPLLYTMEVWWAGFIASPWRLVLLLGFTFVLLLGYNRFAGLRRDATWREIAVDSVEELGLGIVTAAGALYLIGQIGPGTSFDEVLGKVVVETAVVAIGFSVGTAELHAGGDDDRGLSHRDRGRASHLRRELVIAFCGAVLFAANVAPTEEILMIAAETPAVRLAILAAVSLAIGSVIINFSNFKSSDTALHRGGGTDVILGSAITYAVALVASAVMLWFFGRFDGAALEMIVSQTVVLGFPSTLGASAGRLLLMP